MSILYVPERKQSLKAEFYEVLGSKSPAEQEQILSKLSEDQLWDLNNRWEYIARPEQLLPASGWSVAMIRAGRGWGKTRTGAEWFAKEIKSKPGTYALIGQTRRDVQTTMLEDESGLLQCLKGEEYDYNRRDLILKFHNGSLVYGFSGENPKNIRGKNLSGVWYDELSEFQYLEETWKAAQLALRKGRSKTLITTTPRKRSVKFLKNIEARPKTLLIRGSSYDNLQNLSQEFKDELLQNEGTRDGKEEIEAELLEDTGLLWDPKWFKYRPMDPADLARIVVAVDPAMSGSKEAAESGIIIAGLKRGRDGNPDEGQVLSDRSLRGSPEKVAKTAIEAYHEFDAECIVIEINNGGSWLEHSFKKIDPNIRIKNVKATDGKLVRAHPVATQYELGRIYHQNHFLRLEEQMIDFNPDQPNELKDRFDAAVWAFRYLFDKRQSAPSVIRHSIGLW